MGRENEIFDDLLFVFLEKRGVDRNALHVALGREPHLDETAAGNAFNLQRFELGLHRLHLRLQGLSLLHHAHDVFHCRLLVRC